MFATPETYLTVIGANERPKPFTTEGPERYYMEYMKTKKSCWSGKFEGSNVDIANMFSLSQGKQESLGKDMTIILLMKQ